MVALQTFVFFFQLKILSGERKQRRFENKPLVSFGYLPKTAPIALFIGQRHDRHIQNKR